jgi:ferredoxin
LDILLGLSPTSYRRSLPLERRAKKCPTQAMKGIYEKKRKYLLPDCWSCGVCIEVCPANAVKYGSNGKFFLNNTV